ncbi:Gx transporter family protein [candidate division KSB1 bacterium]|nr:Gx transporter family protein [candidate division KSB1 bacterium]
MLMPFFSARKIAQLALLTGFGLILFIFENMLPRPLPWIKLGTAQIASLLALYLAGWREALLVTVARVVLGSLIIGVLAAPTFYLSLGAGLTAILAMSLLQALWGDRISIIGVSLCGAMIHNIAQLILAYWLVVQSRQIFYLLPLLTLPAVFTGLVIGLCSYFLLERAKPLAWFKS